MKTQNYGENGTQFDLNGNECPPLQVIGKHEPQGSFAYSASRDKRNLIIAAMAFFQEHGIPPKKVFSPGHGALKCFSHRFPTGIKVLDVEYGAPQYKAE